MPRCVGEGGRYQFVYDRENDQVLEWIDEPNYGWLWLNAFSACAEIEGTPRFAEAASNLFDASLSYFSAAEEIYTREWSSLLGFGGYYLKRQGGGA